MIQSMTGFFNQEVVWKLESGAAVLLTLEVKSLNSRFFELTTKLSSVLMSQENLLTAVFRQELVRGKVFLSIRAQSDDMSLEQVKLNKPLALSYQAALKELDSVIEQDLKNSGEKLYLKAFEWLSLPKIVSFDNNQISGHDWDKFVEICRVAAKALLQDRLREGALIKEEILKSLLKIEGLQKLVFEAAGEINDDFKLKLEEQKKSLEKSRTDEHSFSFEHKKFVDLEYAVDKSDVTEEMTRSSMHVQSIKKMLDSDDVGVGKKMEFTLQELLRETNTITSKLSDYRVNSGCVEIKVEVEKIREQSQNIV